jgi:site-specific recombinase XerD
VGLLPYRRRRRSPFVYTPDDIAALLDQTHRSLPQPALRAATYRTLIGLLSVTGLRIGETIRLDRSDVDWSEGVLLIRESKIGKSRQVPVQASTLGALAIYAAQRDELQPSPQPSFFVSSRRTRLAYQAVCQTFRALVWSQPSILQRLDCFHAYATDCRSPRCPPTPSRRGCGRDPQSVDVPRSGPHTMAWNSARRGERPRRASTFTGSCNQETNGTAPGP